MDLQQLYYAGELLGILAVIGSLLYVGRQVRQNTASMINAASTDYSNGLNALTISMVMDRDFAEIWTKGESQFDELDEVDKRRLLFYELVGLSTWRRSFDLHQQGLLPEDVWNEQVGGIGILAQRQSVRLAWERFSHTFSPSFRAVVESHMKPARSDE